MSVLFQMCSVKSFYLVAAKTLFLTGIGGIQDIDHKFFWFIGRETMRDVGKTREKFLNH